MDSDILCFDFGKYQLKEKISQGSFGKVYKVLEKETKVIYIAKKIAANKNLFKKDVNYVEMNTLYAIKNEKWLSGREDYLNMVTSPDYRNIHAPIREEEIGHDQSYIVMSVIGDNSSGSKEVQRAGYLDMGSVCKLSNEQMTISSSSPSSQDKEIFSLSGDKVPTLYEDHHSPVEISPLLDKPNNSANNTQNNVQNLLRNNNLNNLTPQQQPLYHNLEKLSESIETIIYG